MSTLKVGTIANTSGSEGSTPAEINSGRAKAWITLDGTGTVGIRESYNISSVADNGTGSYNANLSVTMSSNNMCVVGSGSQGRTGSDNIYGHCLKSTTQIGLYSKQNTQGANEDSDFMFAAVFGDLA
jgi:hypothetical protein|tara:strand:- start:223 stop:603 length:381 start_codon:yes stop_codon:yes gene_type:complete